MPKQVVALRMRLAAHASPERPHLAAHARPERPHLAAGARPEHTHLAGKGACGGRVIALTPCKYAGTLKSVLVGRLFDWVSPAPGSLSS